MAATEFSFATPRGRKRERDEDKNSISERASAVIRFTRMREFFKEKRTREHGGEKMNFIRSVQHDLCIKIRLGAAFFYGNFQGFSCMN